MLVENNTFPDVNYGYLPMVWLQKLINRKNMIPGFRLALHLGFWLSYFAIGYYFNTISYNVFAHTSLSWTEPLFSTINLALFYYPFMYFTWPRFLKRGKYIQGILLLCMQVLIYTVLFEVQERQLIIHCSGCAEILSDIPARFKQGMTQPLIGGIVNTLLSFGIIYVLIAKLSPVIAIKISLDFAKERTNAVELEKENLLLEFNFLKSQINPHFLFNTLNNIHSLVVQDKKQQASGTIARLSDFLRHSLYESGQENILLSKEIKLLQDYIELEKLRLNKTRVVLQIDSDDETTRIPPLLFIPLAENAFKYTADNLPADSFIEITISLTEKTLHFHIRNNYDPGKRNSTGGIGLKNLLKRLYYHYPGKHTVDMNDVNNIYEIKITIGI